MHRVLIVAGTLVSPPDAAASCVSCLQTNVCAPARACASSADCDARVRCWQACRTQECEDACIGSAVYKEAFFEAGSGTSGFVSIGNLIATPDPIAGTCATQCASGGDWGCVGQVSWALPARTTDSINLKLTDLVTSMSVPNVDVQLCAAIDANCNSPIAQGTTDPQGFVALPVQNVSQRTLGLNGFVQMESSNLETTLLYWGFPLGADAVGYWTDALVTTPMEFQAALSSVNVTPLSLRGTLAAVAWDCLEYVAPGVRITLNTADGQTQSKDETGADATVTGPLGVLYFYNVQVGPVTVTATPMALGKASSQVSATVRAGAVTTVFLAPTPNP